MLNLKKGLALVLAAATVFTFAPVNSFAAATGTITSDGLTAKSGIDSIDYGAINVTRSTNATATFSDVIHLKEHNDTAYTGSKSRVTAFRITIDRKLKAGSTDEYEDVVQANDDNSTAGTNTKVKEVTPGKPSSGSLPDTISQRVYVVSNTSPTYNTDNTFATLGGADFYLYNVGTSSAKGPAGTVKIKIEALASNDDAQGLDSTTLSVTVPSGDTTFTLQKTSVTTTEGSNVNVPFVITNPATKPISYLYFTDNQDSVAYVSQSEVGSATAFSDVPSNGHVTIGASDVYGVLKIHAGTVGKTTIKVHAYQDATHELTGTIAVEVKAGNGKLSVTYSAKEGSSFQTMTFTDNAEYTGSGNYSIRHVDSTSQKVDNGALVRGTKLETITHDGKTYVKGSDGTNTGYIKTDSGTASIATTFVAADESKYAKSSTLTDTEKPYVLYELEDVTELPSAQTLYSDGTKTVQISADKVTGADISYSLVATNGSTWKDTDQTTSPSHEVGYGTNYAYNVQKVTADDAGTGTKNLTASEYGQNTKLVYSEDVARKYGSISKDGLVTLKNGDVPAGTNLYVVVSAIPNKEQSDAGQKVSTYLIPIELSVQQPVQFYVSDSKSYIELETRISTGDIKLPGTTRNLRSDEALFLSLKDHKTDKLNIVSNIGDSYIKGSIADDSIASYDDTTRTLTAKKEGTTTLTIKTLSAPDYAGIVTATIPVVVNSLDSSNTLSLVGTSVNKEKPQSKVTATPSVAGTNVVFDRTLYKKDSTRPSGYSYIDTTESGYDDIVISSTGTVTYQKNSGTVYVRAYAQGDATHNPSTWAYIPVNYGQQIVDTELKVDTTPIALNVKDTKKIEATASTGSSISFTSADPTVASVSADGTVTANKTGYTTVTVAATTPDGKTGDSAVITVIVNGAKENVTAPSKVTGLKVKNKKGAKVSVTWTAQDKTVLYRVYKKVGNGSWKAKNVTNAKATLEVKKGAKVQVKVKAFRRDENGKAVWQSGKATKAKAFKTDKK